MNPTPITGSVNEKGMFTAKNPYKYPSSEWIKWNEDNLGKPQLLCYTPSNVLVTDEEHVEVRKGHRIKTTKGWSVLVEADHEVYENSNVELQPCYITIPPTEKVDDKVMKKLTQKTKTALYENHIMMSKLCDLLNTSTNIIKEMAVGNGNSRLLEDDVLGIISYYTKMPISEVTEQQTYTNALTDAKPFKAVDQYYDVFNQAWMDNGEGIENWKEQGFQTRTITEAQPLEGVKTAQEILIEHGCARKIGENVEMLMVASWQVVEAMEAYHAQFATDANESTDANGFKVGQYIVFKGETGARWINNEIYVYLGNGVVTDKGGDIKKPTWPNFIEDNFTAYRGERLCVDYLSALSAPSTHSSSEMVEEWISVKDGLPEHMVKVWVYISSIDKQCEAIYYRNVKCWRKDKDARFDLPVTNWRPLTYPK